MPDRQKTVIAYDRLDISRSQGEDTITIVSGDPAKFRNFYFPQVLIGDDRYELVPTEEVERSGRPFLYVLELSSIFYHVLFRGFVGVLPPLAELVPSRVLKAVQERRARLVICDAQEIRPDLRIFDGLGKWIWFFDLIQIMVGDHGLPPDRVWFLAANFELETQFADWLQAQGLQPEQAFVFRPLFLFDTTTRQADRLARGGRSLRVEEDGQGRTTFYIGSGREGAGFSPRELQAEIDSGHLRPKTFLCLNHTPRDHRKALAFFIAGRGHHARGLLSLNAPSTDTVVDPKLLATPDIRDAVAKGAETLRSSLPLRLDLSTGAIPDQQWAIFGMSGDWLYRSSYISFVTETYLASGRYLTEKVFKPILRLHPFVVVGPAGTLALLRAKGYRTFNRVIDENYDDIADDAQRLAAVLGVIDGLAGLDPVESREVLVALKDEIVYNYHRLLDDETDMDIALAELAA